MSTPRPASLSPVLVLRAEGHRCGVPLVNITEIMRPLPVEALTGAPAGVVGVAMIRGRVTPVLDLAALLFDRTTHPAASTRFVALRVGKRAVALLVDAVLAIRALSLTEFDALPRLWRGPQPPAVAALGTLDRELLTILETSRLLPADWQSPAGGKDAV